MGIYKSGIYIYTYIQVHEDSNGERNKEKHRSGDVEGI